MFSGLTGVGKSWIALNMIKALVEGGALFGNPAWTCRRSRVLYVEEEIGAFMLGERLRMVFGASLAALPPSQLTVLTEADGFYLSDPWCMQELKKIIERLEIDVVVFDPLSKLHTHDESDNTKMQGLVRDLKTLQGGRTAFVLAHHNRKPPSQPKDYDPLDMYNIRGASQIIGDAHSIATVARTGDKVGSEGWVLEASAEKLRNGPPLERFYLDVNAKGHGEVQWRAKGAVDDDDSATDAVPAKRKLTRGRDYFL